MREPKPTDNVSIDVDHFDCALVLKVWDADHQESRDVRIAVEDVPTFMADVVSRSGHALTTAARRLESGHCERCGNTGLVDTILPGNRKSNDHCPDCKPWPVPYRNTPRIGRLDS